MSDPVLNGAVISTLVERTAELCARMSSTWLSRETAALYCQCSASDIDRAADEGRIKRYWWQQRPRFRRSDLDAAMKDAPWPKADTLKTERLKDTP